MNKKCLLWSRLPVLALMIFEMFNLSPRLTAQTTPIAEDYKHVNINSQGIANYSRSIILLHEIYDGILLGDNYIIGTITARRGGVGSLNRLNIAHVNSSSAYNTTYANVVSDDDNTYSWKLKTCLYNGKKYLALDVPYAIQYHGTGFRFAGWSKSTGENLKFIVYQINGVAQNEGVLSDIIDYIPNRQITNYVSKFNIIGDVGIGTTNPSEKLAVNGNIRAKEIKVETANWPDYVFGNDYKLLSLGELESYIQQNKHLPDIPRAEEVEKEGVSLGEMNKLLLKKVEELTLYLIEKEKIQKRYELQLADFEGRLKKIEDK